MAIAALDDLHDALQPQELIEPLVGALFEGNRRLKNYVALSRSDFVFNAANKVCGVARATWDEIWGVYIIKILFICLWAIACCEGTELYGAATVITCESCRV